MLRFSAVFVLTFALFTIGCESSSAPRSSPPAAAVTLDIKNWEETLELVAQHKGKVVVLDLWSTSCDPCMVEFPHLVELHKRHGDKLVCLSASCDYAGIKSKPPETYHERVLDFLTKQNATFQNVLLNVEADAVFEKIDLASIPAVIVFDRDGKIAKRFDNDDPTGAGDFTYTKNVVPFVEELLTK
ncbi:MAG: TlpA family protein disulfide reductase [Planctomycetaceae bacterium]